jgi:hypothetical protein
MPRRTKRFPPRVRFPLGTQADIMGMIKIPKTGKLDTSLTQDEKLDHALDNTFPASDPPSMTQPIKRVGSGKTTGAPTPVTEDYMIKPTG